MQIFHPIINRYRRVLIACFLCLLFAAVDVKAESWSVVLEAEDAQITHPARAIPANGARQGNSVMMSTVNAVNKSYNDSKEEYGRITFRHELPSSGDYFCWGRIKWHCTCSRRFKVDTTSNDFRHGKGGTIESYAPPREWVWMRLGSGFFESGINEIAILPAGHMIQVDALTISSDPEYTPPGFTDSKEAIFFEKSTEVVWKQEKNGMESYILEGGEWMNFQLDFAVPIPSSLNEVQYTVNICEQTEGSTYALHLNKNVSEKLTLTFEYQENEEHIPLLPPIELESSSDWVSLTIVKFDTQIRLGVNGVIVGTVHDDKLPAGTTRFLTSSAQKLGFEEVGMRRLNSWVEIFNEHTSLWRPSGGQWKLATYQGGSEALGYIGHTDIRAYNIAPWTIGDAYKMTVDVNVLNGSGGVAFNIIDDKNYWAVSIPSEAVEQLERAIRLIHLVDGMSEVVWEFPMLVEGNQWHKLELDKGIGTLLITLNSEPIATLKHQDWTTILPVGLYLNSKSTAQWGTIEVRNLVQFPRESLIFEPYCDNTSLSQWEVQAGSTHLNGHPAILVVKSDAEQEHTKMTLQRTVPSNSRIALSLSRPNVTINSTSGELGAFTSDIPLPPLPGEPRIGLYFEPIQGEGASYTAWLDYPNLTHLTIMREEKILKRKTATRFIHAQTPTFYFELRDEGLYAGIDSGVELVVMGSINPENIPMKVSILTEFIKEDQPLHIVEIQTKAIAKNITTRQLEE